MTVQKAQENRMTDIIQAQNLPASYQDLLAQLEPETNLTGGTFVSNRRLSIRGGVFRKVVNGQEVGEIDARSLKVVIAKSAPISRMYYKGTYNPGESNPPTCWATDISVQKPADDVPEESRQSPRCMDCPQNIKGSGQGDSRACRYQQRVAVLIADEDGNIKSAEPYLLSLPATSVFGDDQKKRGMMAYARHLNAHNTPLASVITEVCFDTNSSTPKLWFKAVRPLAEEELGLAVEVQRSPDAAELVAIKVTNSKKQDEEGGDDEEEKPAALPPLFTDEESEDEGEEKETAEAVDDAPKVRKPKKKEEKPKNEDLASLLDEFDDE